MPKTVDIGIIKTRIWGSLLGLVSINAQKTNVSVSFIMPEFAYCSTNTYL